MKRTSPLSAPNAHALWMNSIGSTDASVVQAALVHGCLSVLVPALIVNGLDYIFEQWSIAQSQADIRPEIIEYIEQIFQSMRLGVESEPTS